MTFRFAKKLRESAEPFLLNQEKKVLNRQNFQFIDLSRIFHFSLQSSWKVSEEHFPFPQLWNILQTILLTMPTCSGPRSKLEPETSSEMKKDILLLDFPQNAGVRWNKNCPPPNQYKGVYTWTSTPRTLYQNRKLIRENLNLQRWVENISRATVQVPAIKSRISVEKSFTHLRVKGNVRSGNAIFELNNKKIWRMFRLHSTWKFIPLGWDTRSREGNRWPVKRMLSSLVRSNQD